MANLITSSSPHNAKIELFRERCEARALLWVGGAFDLQEAVDVLPGWAVSLGLTDMDEVQEIMAKAFEARRIRL